MALTKKLATTTSFLHFLKY
uniref:Uncharacterized protein n=1 Tax=Anguilla anguilla TaxID=7936 RepID=A0A0E9PWE9_ANGAN